MKAPLARFACFIVFLMAAGYAFFTLHGPKGIPALLDKQRQIQEMEKRNASLAQEIERKRERIKRLSDDPAEQELEIRKQMKLAHPDEKIYIVGEPEKK